MIENIRGRALKLDGLGRPLRSNGGRIPKETLGGILVHVSLLWRSTISFDRSPEISLVKQTNTTGNLIPSY